MTESCTLIDDRGRVFRWPDESRCFDIAYRDPDFDFPDYAVRNLGFVMIAERPQFLRVRLRPVFSGHRTTMALFAFVAERAPIRAAISQLSRGWHDEVCSGQVLLRRLREILHASSDASEQPPFLAAPRRLSGLMTEPGNQFAPVLRRWLDNIHPSGISAFLASSQLYDRAMIVERMPDSGRFVFRHSGHRLQLYPVAWSQSAIGRDLESQPDKAYGRWIAKACHAVDERQVPRFELITARVAQNGSHARLWRYERLMLPWRDGDGRRFVVSVSLRDQADSRFG
jgi:hypothetical protein